MTLTLTVSRFGTIEHPFYALTVAMNDRQHIPEQVRFLLTGGANEPISDDRAGAFNNVGGILSPAVNQWIIENGYHDYPLRQPTKLKFKLLKNWLVFVEKIR